MLKLFILFSSLFVFLIDPVTCMKIKQPSLGDCGITILSIYPCPEDPGYGDAKATLKTINDDGDKAVDLSVTIKDPIDEKYSIIVQIDLYENGQSKEIYYHEEPLCDYILKYAPKAWARLRKSLVPPIEFECYGEPGYYEILNFEASANEVDVPASIYGTGRAIFKIFDPDGELLSCKVMEADVYPKSSV